MRILLICTALFTGCCFSAGRTSLAQAEIATEPISSEIDSQEQLFYRNELEVPEEISTDILPDSDVYPITVRVVIEGQPVTIPSKGGKIVTRMWWARTANDVIRDLSNAEEIYNKIGLKFVVTEVVYREFNPNMLRHFVDANVHQGMLTVVYMLPNGFSWDGYSSGPWEDENKGIIISYLADEWTLAHEVGHYFGLLHPFDEDFVDDTPEQKTKYCAGKELSTPNCHNIMNYCDHTPKHVTAGQIARFKRFLRAKRMDHLDRERPDMLLRGQEFFTPVPKEAIVNFPILPKIKELPELP